MARALRKPLCHVRPTHPRVSPKTNPPAPDHVMTSAPDRRAAHIYKKTYFGVSHTWDTWNKLTARDVFALTEEPGFEGQHVYFHGNHPIRYVYLCGIVLQFELAPGAGATKYALLMLDDGSGRAIEVKIPRRQKRDLEDGEVFLSNTLIDNLNVHASLGLASLFIDNKPVHVGTILKVKGTIAVFRNRQIELKRVFLVKDTNEEVTYWASLAQFRRDVLAQPWVLTHAQMKAVDDEIEAQDRRERERKKAKQAKLLRDRERKGKSDEKKERQRKRLQEVLDDGALVGSNVIKAPWE